MPPRFDSYNHHTHRRESARHSEWIWRPAVSTLASMLRQIPERWKRSAVLGVKARNSSFVEVSPELTTPVNSRRPRPVP